jgi:Asp-tRNA(Asn)/Glu-tRNA(Gln) amidotransferase B subunit
MRLENLGIAPHTARALSSAEPELRKTFEESVALGAKPVAAANWVAGELTATMRRLETPVSIDGPALFGLIAMTEDGRLSSSAAKEVLVEMLKSGDNADVVASRLDLLQISDISAIEEAVAEVLAGQAGAVERYRAGEEKVLGFLVGMVMKSTGGKADPKVVNQILRRHLA